MVSLRSLQELKNEGVVSREQYWLEIRDFLLTLEEFNAWQIQQGVQIKLDNKGLLIESSIIRDSNEREILRLDPSQIRSAPFTILAEGCYEQFQLEITVELGHHSRVFLDIGANVGVYGIALATRLSNLQILAFEPLLKCFRLAQENFKLNNCSDRISAFNFALGDEITNRVMFTPLFTGTAGASFANQHPNEGLPTRETVEVKTLDSLHLSTVDLIKIDVEGFEFQVLQGGRETLAREKPTVIVEILRKWSKSFEKDPRDSFNLLVDLGYQCYEIKKDFLAPILEMDTLTDVTNFIFCHKSQKQHLEVLEKFVQ
jgi:FkbM family methyltransferase